MTRLSRERTVYRGSMKGMPAKTYYFVQAIMQSTSLVRRSAKYMDRSLWTKFDRQKPLSQRQGGEVAAALNRTLMDDTPDYPFNVAAVRMSTLRVPGKECKRIYTIKEIVLSSLKSMGTELGNAYIVDPNKKLLYQGNEGIVTFSRHAIERMMERITGFRDCCKNEPMAAVFMLAAAGYSSPQEGDGTMLPVLPFGYFPVVYAAEGVWVCTSFLAPDMEGTPRENRKDNPSLLPIKELLTLNGTILRTAKTKTGS